MDYNVAERFDVFNVTSFRGLGNVTLGDSPGNHSQVITPEVTTEQGSYVSHEELIDAIHSRQFMILVPAFVYTAALMLIGMPGNAIVIIVYLLKMGRTTSRHFIISLAICDFVNCAFGMPIELSLLANYYKFDHPILCKGSRFLTFCMNNTSSLVLLGIAVDRFRRVCLPLRPNMTVYHSKIICYTSVAISVAYAVPAILIFGTLTIRYPTGLNGTSVVFLKACYVNDLETKLPMIFSLCLIIGTLSIFFALVVLYAFVGRAVCRRRNADNFVEVRKMTKSDLEMTTVHQTGLVRRNAFTQRIWRSLSTHSPKLRHGNGTNITEPFTRSRTVSDTSVRRHGGKGIRAGRTTMILFLVTLFYMLTFVPYLVLSTMRHVNPHYTDGMTPVETSIYNVTLRSYLLNSAVNPIIYCFLNRQFRLKVKLFFLNLCKCRTKV